MGSDRTLLVKILGDASGAQKAADDAGGAFGHLGSLLGKLGAVLVGVFAVDKIKNFVEGSVSQFTNLASQTKQLMTLTGGTAEQMSALSFAAGEVNVSTDALGLGIKTLSKNMETNNKNLKDAGIAYRDVHGNVLPLNQALGNVAAKFASMPDGVNKTALATQLFGRRGAELIPLLNKGKTGLADLEAEAKKYGLTLSQDNINALNKNIQAHKDLSAAMDGLKVQVGAYLLPIFTSLVTMFNSYAIPAIISITGWIQGSNGLKGAFSDLINIAQNVIQALTQGFRDGTNGFSSSINGPDGIIGILINIGATVHQIFGDAVKIFDEFTGHLGSGGAAGGVSSLSTAFSTLAEFALGVLDALQKLLSLIAAHPTAFKDTAEAILAIVAAYKLIKFTNNVISFAASGVDAVLSAIGKIAGGLSGLGGKTVSVAAQGAQGVADKAAGGAAQAAGGGASSAASNVAQNVAGGAAANALDLKAWTKKIPEFAKGLISAIGSALETAALALLYVGEAIVEVIFSPEILTAAAVVAVGTLIAVFHKEILGFLEMIPGWVGSGIASMGNFASFLVGKGVELAVGLFTGIANQIANLPQYLLDVIGAALFGISALVGLTLHLGYDLIIGLLDGFAIAFVPVAQFLLSIPFRAVALVGDLGAVLYVAGSALLEGFWHGVTDIWNANAHFWIDIVPMVLGYIGNLATTLYSHGVDLVSGFWHGVLDAWSNPVAFFLNAARAISGFVGDLGSTLWAAGAAAVDGLRFGAVAAWRAVASFFSSLGGSISGSLSNAGSWLYDAGRNILIGLYNGIVSMWSKLMGLIGDLANDIKKGFSFGVHLGSPSKDFHQYGVWIGQGLIDGLNEIAPNARAAIDSLAYVPPMPNASSGGSSSPAGLSSGHQIEQNINVHAETNADPFQIANEVGWTIKTTPLPAL